MSENNYRVIQVCLSKSWGGLEMFAAEMAQVFNKKGLSCITIVPPDSTIEDYLRRYGCAVRTVSGKKDSFRSVRDLARQNPSAPVVCHVLSQLKLLSWGLWRLPNSLVGVAHVFMGINKKGLMHRLTYRRVNKVICFTNQQKNNLLETLPLTENKIVGVAHGVDLERFHPRNRSDQERSKLAAAGEVVIGVVGRLDPQKGQYEAVEALEILSREGLKPKLIFVGNETEGEAGELKRLKDKVKGAQLESQVRFVPHTKDIELIVANFDIFIMPSHKETFGRVLIEAMASGVPCISTRAGGVPDIVRDQVDGLLVTPKSAPDLANAIKKLLRDDSLRKRLAHGARQRVEEKFDRRRADDNFCAAFLK